MPNQQLTPEQLAANTAQNNIANYGVPSSNVNPSDMVTALQEKLLGQSGIISSTNSTLQDRLNEAIASTKASTTASDLATKSEYDRSIAAATEKGSQDIIAGRAGGEGGVLNLAALRELTNTTDKNLKDLEQRKQELILQNDAAGAKAIADLQLKAIDFQQKANQDVFSNLLKIGDYSLTAQSEKRAQDAATQATREAVGKLIQDNPKAGILANDSIEQAYAKIGKAPDSLSVQKTKAEIWKLYNDTKASGKLTAAERLDAGLSKFTSIFVPGQKTGYTPNVFVDPADNQTYINPDVFKKAVLAAPSQGVSRSAFLENFASMLQRDKDGFPIPAYGITKNEARKYIDKNL